MSNSADYPTAQDCRAVAVTLHWLANRTDSHEGHDDKETYRAQAGKLMAVSALLEANPNYFTERNALRIVA